MKKFLKPLLLLVALGLLAYNSVYFKKLDAVKKNTQQKFDAVAFTQQLWKDKMIARLDSAVELSVLINAIAKEPEAAFNNYTNSLAVGNYRYAMVKFNAEVVDAGEDELLLKLPVADSFLTVKLATEFIYGNALRDASKLLMIRDFPNTADLNAVSEELNKTVRSTVVAPFKQTVKKGDKIAVVGAIEINKAHVNWKGLEVIPARLQNNQ